MAERVRRSPPVKRVTPLEDACRQLGARPPTEHETQALKRLFRLEPLAWSYLLGELCGAGKVPFDVSKSEATHAAAFRSGSLAVAIATLMIVEAPVLKSGVERDG